MAQDKKMALDKKDLCYYMTLFKIEGHTTYRGHFAAAKDAFDKQLQPTTPKITERKVYRIDRITGELTLQK